MFTLALDVSGGEEGIHLPDSSALAIGATPSQASITSIRVHHGANSSLLTACREKVRAGVINLSHHPASSV